VITICANCFIILYSWTLPAVCTVFRIPLETMIIFPTSINRFVFRHKDTMFTVRLELRCVSMNFREWFNKNINRFVFRHKDTMLTVRLELRCVSTNFREWFNKSINRFVFRHKDTMFTVRLELRFQFPWISGNDSTRKCARGCMPSISVLWSRKTN
jgi:Fe-S cluster biosynthesis and repair protein YggX